MHTAGLLSSQGSEQRVHNVLRRAVDGELLQDGASIKICATVAPHVGAQVAKAQRGVDVFGIQGRQDDTVRHSTIMNSMRPFNADTFFAWDGDVLVLNVLGKPASRKDAIGKPHGAQLKVSVTAAPQGGRATDHMVRFLAPLFGVAVRDIEVVYGRESVNKQLRIHSPKVLPTVFTDPKV